MTPAAKTPDTPPLSLRDFVPRAWPQVDPHKYVPNWPSDAIAEHLEAVSRGQIRNLIINEPPRLGKSIEVSAIWPAWEWSWRPERCFLYATYAEALTFRDSLRTRRLIASPWYQSNWGGVFRIRKDKDTQRKFENDRGGFRFATSVGGIGTGEGADAIVIDDPLKADTAESETVREFANRWYKETMTTRRDDLKTGVRVICMQRLHENDLTGFVLSESRGLGWDYLCLPMEYEPFRDQRGVDLPKPVTSIGWSDPRIEEGELLIPERVGPAELEELKNDLGDYGTAGQLQQRPAPRGGGIIKRAWFEVVTRVPTTCVWVRYWDKASTKGGRGARTAGALVGWDPMSGNFYIKDMKKDRWSIEERDAIMKETADADGLDVLVWVEQEPGSGGRESAINTVKLLPNYVVFIDRVTGDKTLRAHVIVSKGAAGLLKMVLGEWNDDFLSECATFPNGRYKDQVDCVAGAINKLTEGLPFESATAGVRPTVAVR